MSTTNAVTRRQAIQTMGAVAGLLLIKPRITLAHQEIQGGLTIFAAAAETDDAVMVLARHQTDGFQLRRLVSQNRSVVANNIIDSHFPENFWPLDLGLRNGYMSSVIGSSTEYYPQINEYQRSLGNIEMLDEPFGPPEVDYTRIYEIERPAIWVNHNISLMDGRGIVAASVQKDYHSIEIVLRPAYEDGDHLSAVTVVVDDTELPFSLPQDDLPVGSATAFIKSDGKIVVAVDTVSEKLIVQEMDLSTKRWKESQVLHNAIPSSVSISASNQVKSRQRRTNGDIVDVELENIAWRAVLSPRDRRNTYALPTESIPIKGRKSWLVHTGNGQLQISN